jgi:regulator of replication initiation timing
MNLDKENYSRNEVEQMLSEYESKIQKLEKSIADFETVKQQYAELQKNNLATAIKNEMLKAGLDESYFDLVEAEDVKKAQEKINKLVELKKKQDINNSYKPSDHKPDDSYSNFEKSGNVEGMIKSKITRFFGKE